MTLIVEDGTLILGATSYVTVAEANAYFSARGVSAWNNVPDTPTKEQYLLVGADYLNYMYSWLGEQYSIEQSMALPTSGIAGVPMPVKVAQMVLALEAIKGELAASTTGPSILSERKKLEGVGETEIKYGQDQTTGWRRFPNVVGLLRPYIIGSTGSSLTVGRRVYG